jgi:hypothetical protein
LWSGTDRLIGRLENPSSPDSVFQEGMRVKHTVFGHGTVIESDKDNDTVRVRFDDFGVRRISQEVLVPAEEE